MNLSEYMLLSEEARRRHTDLETPCETKATSWAAQSQKVFQLLLELSGLEDDIGNRRGAGVHVAHLCDNHSHSQMPCTNVRHCFLSTVQENSRRKPPGGVALPAYDGSYGDLPLDPLTTTEMLERHKVTKPTLFKRRDALVQGGFIKPRKVGPRVLYDPGDVYYFDCIDYWIRKGRTVIECVTYLRELEEGFWAAAGSTDPKKQR